MEEWKEYRLGEIGKIITGKTPRTAIKGNYGGTIPFLTPSDDMACKFVSHTNKTLTPLGLAEVKNCLLPENSICVSCIGSDLGKVVKTQEPSVTNQQINSIIPYKAFDADFVYYLMCIVGKDLNFISKTSTAVPIVNKSTFSNYKVRIPQIGVQKAIGNILSSLDDKIELNRKINSNLEEQAKALFKSWFIDFEPFKDGKFVDSELGKIPEGWKVLSLDNIADYLNGLAMQKYRPATGEQTLPVLKIKELGQGYCDASCDKCSSKVPSQYIVNDGDVIFSWSGTLMVDLWCGGKCGLNQHLFKVSSKDYPKWFYLMWTLEHLNRFIHIAKDKAVTMGHIKREELHKAKVVVPTTPIFNKANMLFAPIVDEMINTRISNRSLSVVRDTLLPKLMSGEIEV